MLVSIYSSDPRQLEKEEKAIVLETASKEWNNFERDAKGFINLQTFKAGKKFYTIKETAKYVTIKEKYTDKTIIKQCKE